MPDTPITGSWQIPDAPYYVTGLDLTQSDQMKDCWLILVCRDKAEAQALYGGLCAQRGMRHVRLFRGGGGRKPLVYALDRRVYRVLTRENAPAWFQVA